MLGFSDFHLFCVYYLVLFELAYFCAICASLQNLHKYIWRIRVLLPAYYMGFALVFFTGLLIEAEGHFSGFAWGKFAVLVAVLALAIAQFRQFKRARKLKNLAAFRRVGLLLGGLKIALLIATGWAF